MKRLLTKLIPSLVIAMLAGTTAVAQGYYDDDIYYDASKARKEKQEKALEAARKAARSNYIPSQPVADYAGSDTYVVDTRNTRDVDEYNRRYSVSPSGKELTDSISLDQLTQGDFANTRRIERFSNPDVVTETGDGDFIDYYYSEAAQPQTTVIINNIDPWAYNPWSWRYNWAYNPWYYGYYDPWYVGPSWSWSWGWGPSWSWSWGWGGGWCPGWNHPGWHYPSYGPVWSGNNWRPSSPGASRPHVAGGVTPSTPGRRPGNSYYTGGSNRNNYNGGTTTVPGSRVNQNAGRRPSAVNSGSGTSTVNRGSSTSGNRGTTTVPGSRVTRGRSSSNNNNSYNTNQNSNSNRSSWSSGSRNSGSSSWGGGGRSSGGGSRSTGGGGGGRSRRH